MLHCIHYPYFIFNNLLEKRTKESASTAINDGIIDEDEDQFQSVSRRFY